MAKKEICMHNFLKPYFATDQTILCLKSQNIMKNWLYRSGSHLWGEVRGRYAFFIFVFWNKSISKIWNFGRAGICPLPAHGLWWWDGQFCSESRVQINFKNIHISKFRIRGDHKASNVGWGFDEFVRKAKSLHALWVCSVHSVHSVHRGATPYGCSPGSVECIKYVYTMVP